MSNEKKPEAQAPPALRSDISISSTTSTPAQIQKPESSAQPSSIPIAQEKPAQTKPPEPSKEERQKMARSLLEQQIKQISKRESIPENMVRLELYLEARMRKFILPKIDRLASDVRTHHEQMMAIKTDLNGMLTRTWVIPENQPPIEEISPEIPPAPVVPVEPSFDPDDALFGTLALYFELG